MNSNKKNPVLDIALGFAVGLLVILLGLYVLAVFTAFLWNFVMPVLGLPTITPVHALALLFLCKIFKSEYNGKKNIILNTNVNPAVKETKNV